MSEATSEPDPPGRACSQRHPPVSLPEPAPPSLCRPRLAASFCPITSRTSTCCSSYGARTTSAPGWLRRSSPATRPRWAPPQLGAWGRAWGLTARAPLSGLQGRGITGLQPPWNCTGVAQPHTSHTCTQAVPHSVCTRFDTHTHRVCPPAPPHPCLSRVPAVSRDSQLSHKPELCKGGD